MITTIYRRGGSVLLQLETTTTTGETDAEVRLNLRGADLRNADLRNAVGLTGFFQVGPIDSWWVSATIETNGWIFRAGCHRFTEAEAREWWRPENLPAWTKGSAPDHGARMLAGVDALIALAKAHNWPEKLEEENPE